MLNISNILGRRAAAFSSSGSADLGDTFKTEELSSRPISGFI